MKNLRYKLYATLFFMFAATMLPAHAEILHADERDDDRRGVQMLRSGEFSLPALHGELEKRLLTAQKRREAAAREEQKRESRSKERAATSTKGGITDEQPVATTTGATTSPIIPATAGSGTVSAQRPNLSRTPLETYLGLRTEVPGDESLYADANLPSGWSFALLAGAAVLSFFGVSLLTARSGIPLGYAGERRVRIS